VEIPDVTRRTFEREIKKRVAPGATIWTDGHASYKWLGEEDSGFKWDYVIHSDGEFYKDTEFSFEHDGPVSTNAVEGLFSRFKKHVRRTKQVMHPNRTHYGNWIGEFLFIEKYLNQKKLKGKSWRGVAFFHMIRLVLVRACVCIDISPGCPAIR